MGETILWFQDIKPSKQRMFGSKAFNLGVIANKSRTSPGFCLSAEAYYHTLQLNGIHAKIRQLLKDIDCQDIEAIEEVSRKVQYLITKVSLTSPIEQELKVSYDKLLKYYPGSKVAVRSSATAEDLPSASFAGQLDSFLDIQDFIGVTEAVIKCWCSLWNPRAIHYRMSRGIGQSNVGMAVIIQQMVPAEVSGVMFTANPLSNSRKEIYIEAVKGLGEQLVQGEVSGEKYGVMKNGLYIPTKDTQDNQPLLTDFHIRWLASEGVKLEHLYGAPQDIEWAYHWGEIYILQTRPITTLNDEIPDEVHESNMNPIQRDVWTNINERFPEPVLPLDSVIAKTYYLSLFEAYQQLGFSVSRVNWDRVEEGIFPDFFMPPSIKPNFLRIFKVWKLLWINIDKEWQVNEAIFDRYLNFLKRDALKDFPMEIIQEYLEEALKDFQRANIFRYLIYIQYGTFYKALEKLLKMLLGAKGQALFYELVVGEDQITMQMNQELRNLARKMKNKKDIAEIITSVRPSEVEMSLKNKIEAQEILLDFNLFLNKYGDRELSQGLGGIAAEIWRDRPEVVWGMLKGMLINGQQAASNSIDGSQRRKIAEEELENLTSKGFWRISMVKRLIQRLIRYSRQYTAFREDSHYYLTQAMPVFRSLFLAIGQKLVRRGIIKEDKEVLFLTYWELKTLLYDIYSQKKVSSIEMNELLATRKAEFQRRKERWANQAITVECEGNILIGVGASMGKVTGKVKIIIDPKELSRLEPGDILVAQYTNPSWTPVFSFVGGLVVEHGSAISHAAIIAREYGIPAVMGIKGITKKLSEGEIVTLDGSKGTVLRSAG